MCDDAEAEHVALGGVWSEAGEFVGEDLRGHVPHGPALPEMSPF